MTRIVRFHPLATAEVEEAQLWYENRMAGLGDRFLVALYNATDAAAQRPNAGVPTRTNDIGEVLERTGWRRCSPYVVVYRATASDLEDGTAKLLPVSVITAAHSRFVTGQMILTRKTEDLLLGPDQAARSLPSCLFSSHDPRLERSGRVDVAAPIMPGSMLLSRATYHAKCWTSEFDRPTA